MGFVRGLEPDTLPQSHFPILVPADVRAKLRRQLADRGIDTDVLFDLPEKLDREAFPNGEEHIALRHDASDGRTNDHARD